MKIHASWIVVLGLLAGTARAAELEVASCNTDIGPGAVRATLKLVIDDSGKLVAKSGPLGSTLETTTDQKVDAVQRVTEDFRRGFDRANQHRDTGIRSADIKRVQHVFLSGNSDFHSDLYKLIDANGKTLGWAASIIVVSGCYAD